MFPSYAFHPAHMGRYHHPSYYSPHHRQHQHPILASHHQYPTFVPPPAPIPASYDYFVPVESSDFEYYPSLEQEERIALDHLQAIRRRREEAERLERQAREAEAVRQAEAIRQAYLIQREREAEERAIAIALQRQQEQQQRQRQLAVLEERKRQLGELVRRKAEHAARVAAEETARRAGKCARRCAQQSRQIARDQTTSHQNELEQLNGILGSLFGINLIPEETSVDESHVEQNNKSPTVVATDTPATQQSKKVEFTETTKSVKKTRSSTKRVVEKEEENRPVDEESDSADKPVFPEQINDLLSTFLGLRVEPTSASDADASSTNKTSEVPQGLNEVLSQFGLEFFPDTPSTSSTNASVETSTKTSSSTFAEASATAEQRSFAKTEDKNIDPLSAFLTGATGADLPPFVRDILDNVEAAFKESHTPVPSEKEEVKGKGKGVADGERAKKPVTVTPPKSKPSTPVTVEKTEEENEKETAQKSLSALEHIAEELALVKDSFTFPSTLSFSNVTTTDNPTPALPFNKTNRPFHEQSNKLLQLLLQADSVTSGGDRAVRQKRKEVVGRVERELEDLERQRDEVWAQVQKRREAGDELDLGSDTETSTVADGEQLNNDVKVERPVVEVQVNTLAKVISEDQTVEEAENVQEVEKVEEVEKVGNEKVNDDELQAKSQELPTIKTFNQDISEPHKSFAEVAAKPPVEKAPIAHVPIQTVQVEVTKEKVEEPNVGHTLHAVQVEEVEDESEEERMTDDGSIVEEKKNVEEDGYEVI
ncbi:hypothetical protein M231_03638 [Tremella mesenterica]|uniref:BAG domain-containing protein n=1 Tax=Tremella mesenterica TaxID=5217 RepID=A0A4Q1BMR9_TREME|nr:uncharacterized protein TREMEDRAFT_59428 [Tremella mesenterica DSM 1558]EIW73262.1 hypothetical protein TREMEDRAFT_59428 [Tremella mesenterica DSM 1558]RXK39133.1 hypothetical protein M231_03638 [Tremella mesenterica]